MSCLREERVALVTGGSRGIGAAIVKELAAHGYNTAVNYKERLQEAEAVVAGIVEQGGRSIAVGADIGDRGQVERMVDNVLEAFGRIDVLVNNAGINRDRTLARMTDEEWDEVIATDLSGVFFCTKIVASGMVKRRWGRVVQSIVGCGPDGQHWPVQLRSGQGWCYRVHQKFGRGTCAVQHYGERYLSGLYRYGHGINFVG